MRIKHHAEVLGEKFKVYRFKDFPESLGQISNVDLFQNEWANNIKFVIQLEIILGHSTC